MCVLRETGPVVSPDSSVSGLYLTARYAGLGSLGNPGLGYPVPQAIRS